MAHFQDPSTPWTVRTTKRKARASEPGPRKRPRLSYHLEHPPRTVPNSRQQTLTQIQLAPYASSPPKHDRMEATEVHARRKTLKKPIELIQPREPQSRKGLKKQTSTLTQMGFLAMDRHEDEWRDEGLGMITPATFKEPDANTGRDHVDPDIGAMASRPKCNIACHLGGVTSMKTQKRRTTSSGKTAGDQGWHGVTPKPTNQGGVSGKQLSGQKPGPVGTKATLDLLPRTTRAVPVDGAEKLRSEPRRLFVHDEKENLGVGGRSIYTIPETPKKRRDFIPSSQSPESVSVSGRKRPVLLHEVSAVSPLKERSTNITLATTPSRIRGLESSPGRKELSNNRKICVLKYGPGRFRKPGVPGAQLHGTKVREPKLAKPIQGLLGQNENMILSIADYAEGDGGAMKAFRQAKEPEIPETSQILASEVIPSSQTDTEEEEIPETSQGLRRIVSASTINRSEESLQMLSDADYTPLTAKKKHSKEGVDWPDCCLVGPDVEVHDFGIGRHAEQNILSQTASATLPVTNSVGAAVPGLPAQFLQKESAVTTIDDSQDDEDNDVMLPLPASTANHTEFNEGFMRGSLEAAAATARHLSPARNTPPGSPTLPPAPFQARYPPATTRRIPAKLNLSSSSSSPTLPRPPPATASRRSTTQRSIHPASMTRPSQMSTQNPTQQSWLPMSSTPYPDAAFISSPHHDNRTSEHIAIKDSSSVSMPLQDIPSESQLQSCKGYDMVDLGLDNVSSSEDDDLDRDEDLDPKSPPPHHLLRRSKVIEKNQCDNNNNRYFCEDEELNPGIVSMTADTSKEIQRRRRTAPPPEHRHARSPARGSRHDQHHKPLSRLHLPESMLESLPGPPGWVAPPDSNTASQPVYGNWNWNWDDSML